MTASFLYCRSDLQKCFPFIVHDPCGMSALWVEIGKVSGTEIDPTSEGVLANDILSGDGVAT